MKVKVYAKLNLSLHVGNRQGEFHPIDSVVASVDIFDAVEVNLRADSVITVSGTDDVPLYANTAYRAAEAFSQAFGVGGCDISIEKYIPMGAGLGGSSADAAAVVYCLCALHGVDTASTEVKSICARVGSDINFMLHGGIARMTGKGDDLQPLPYSQMYFAVTTFPAAMSTKEVFARFDEMGSEITCDNDEMAEYLVRGNTAMALSMCVNGLQPSVHSISPYAERYLHFCAENNIRCTMTGSGSAYFVPFRSYREAVAICQTLCDNGFVTTVCRAVPHGVEEIAS